MPKKSALRGVIPSVATPLTDQDRVDEPSLRQLVRFLLSAGVHGILANGTMSGFAFLTDQEQIRAISIVVDEVRGAVPVIGCIAETSTSCAIPRALQIQKCGVTYLSVLLPFYFFAAQEHLIAYFSDIASAVELPILVYNNPVMTKNRILPETVATLRKRIPRIIGIKESDSDCINLQNLLALTSDDEEFSVLTGNECLSLVGLQMGCSGFIGGLHNICPHLAVRLYDAFREGHLEIARDLQRTMSQAWRLFEFGNVWGGFDEALRYLKIAERVTGAPYSSKLSSREAGEVHRIIESFVKPSFG
ncbi:MAG TPA: dihydrodipicolinate synthase family protein [Candidatus Sulfotelmatobacter sp.]|jgi:4-hydroxy-tetrahydrodipicolinate synthase